MWFSTDRYECRRNVQFLALPVPCTRPVNSSDDPIPERGVLKVLEEDDVIAKHLEQFQYSIEKIYVYVAYMQRALIIVHYFTNKTYQDQKTPDENENENSSAEELFDGNQWESLSQQSKFIEEIFINIIVCS